MKRVLNLKLISICVAYKKIEDVALHLPMSIGYNDWRGKVEPPAIEYSQR